MGEGALVSPWVVLGGYVLISLTDKLDGHLARSRGEITTFGKFLDPIADKLAVIVALNYLLEIRMVSPWVLFIVLSREFLVSGLRMVVASRGVVVAASNLGKWKTATTMIAICGLMALLCIPEGPVYTCLWWVSYAMLAVACILTAWSGLDYAVKSWNLMKEEA
jgi:CDP-diacylglycerol--glycerol-3-phosphate 3-phosphatidyltransferase